MWVWSLEWDEVRADLLVGSCPVAPADLDRIRIEARAGALLSLQTDACRAYVGGDYPTLARYGEQIGLRLENAPMRDFDPQDQRRRLPAAVHRLHALLSAGHRVYVHCTAGINRSPLTVLGYLTFVEGLAPGAALDLIRGARRAAAPYLDAYEACRDDLVRLLRDLIAQRAAGADPAAVQQAAAAVLREGFTLPASAAGARLAGFLGKSSG